MKDSHKTGKLTIMLICATKLKTSRDVIASIRFGNERLETTPSKDSGGGTCIKILLRVHNI